MAVVVGTAQGKLTLDASKFLSTINESYKSLEKLNDLVDKTSKALKDLPDNKSIKVDITGVDALDKLNPTGPLGGFDSNGYDYNGLYESIGKANTQVSLLEQALNGGLTVALQGVGTLITTTFSGFEKYTKFIVGFAKDSLNTGTQFDATMSQVQAVSQATEEEFDELRKKAMDMGAETKFSASEAGQAMVYMGMAGWDAEQIIGGLDGVMSLAAASGEDLATTSDIVTDALTAFGLKATDASHFADVLASASINSNTNVALLGESFKYVAPLAGTLKFSIEDAAVALGTMANSGIKGSQAGTALRTTLTNLLKPSKQMKEAMDAFGISMQDDEGNALDLMGTMEMLRKKLSDIPEVTAEEAAALNDAAGQIEMYRKHKKDFLEAFDTEEEANAAFQAALDTVAQIGSVYGKTQEEMLAMSSYLGASLEQTQATVAATIAGKYGLSGLLAIVNATDEDFNKLTRDMKYASVNLSGITDAVTKSGVAWDKYDKKVYNAEKVQDKLIDTMIDDLTNLGLSGDEAREHLEMEFGLDTEDAQKALEALSEVLYESGGAASNVEDIMMNNLQGSMTIFNSTMETFKLRVSDTLKGPANEFVNFGKSAIDQMITAMDEEGIIGIIKVIGDIAASAIPLIAKYVPEVLPALVEGFWGLVNGIIDIIPDALPVVIDGAVTLFMGLITGLDDTVARLIPMVPDIVDRLCDALLNNADTLIESAFNLFLNLIIGITNALPKILTTAAKLVGKIAHALYEHRSEIITTAINLIAALIEGLLNPETLQALVGAIGEITMAIIDAFGKVDWLETANTIFGAIGTALEGIFSTALKAIDEMLGTDLASWFDEVTKFVKYLKEQSFEMGKSLAAVMNKTENDLNDLSAKYNNTYQDMLSEYAELVKSGVDAADAMARAYQKYFTSGEAQYVFRERFATSLSGGALAERIGTSGMTNEQIVELLSKQSATTGNTYNFYSPKAIDEKTAADEIRSANEDIIRS